MRYQLRHCTVLLRHGDRAPSVNFFERQSIGLYNAAQSEYHQLWIQKLPSKETLAKLNQQFPVTLYEDATGGQEAKYPFGQLTAKGLDQLYERGVQAARRYSGVRFTDISAQSTEYARTQQSAQGFLSGLCSSLGPENQSKSIAVHVNNPHKDMLNPWDTVAELQKAVQNHSNTDPWFDRMEERYSGMRSDMCAGLDYYDANPNNFLWVYAMDYFVCHEAHGLEMNESLYRHRQNVMDLVARRFLKWYSVPSICKLAIGGLFEEIQRQSKEAQARQDCHLAVFSAHDVTLLPFVVALCKYEGREVDSLKYSDLWPSYATAINIEHLADEQNEMYVRIVKDSEELLPITRASDIQTLWNAEKSTPSVSNNL